MNKDHYSKFFGSTQPVLRLFLTNQDENFLSYCPIPAPGWDGTSVIILSVPELPEVETVTNGIKPFLEGQKIVEVKVLRPQLRIKIPANFKKLSEKTKILKVYRRAKYILIDLDNNFTIIIHLGMSGRLTINRKSQEKIFHHKKQSFAKHDHLYIKLESGNSLLYNDTRKFGLVTITETKLINDHKLFKKLGLEPLDKSFDSNVFYNLIHKRNKSIKSVIMDANIIVGIGNIYACEALYKAGIHPEKLSSKIPKEKAQLLLKAIKETLKKAIKAGGSTLKDYTQADGEAGYFQHEFLVYGREQQDCKKCKKKITRIKQNGRSTFLCLSCQS